MGWLVLECSEVYAHRLSLFCINPGLCIIAYSLRSSVQFSARSRRPDNGLKTPMLSSVSRLQSQSSMPMVNILCCVSAIISDAKGPGCFHHSAYSNTITNVFYLFTLNPR